MTLRWNCQTTSRNGVRHRERHTSTFAPWLGRPGEKTLRRKKRRFCARLVIFRRHFHIITIVLCVHFIPHYCIIVNNAKYFFEIPFFLYVLKCLIKIEVVKKKRHFSKYLVKIHIKYSFILGNGQTTSLTVHICALVQGRRKGKEPDASVFQNEAD